MSSNEDEAKAGDLPEAQTDQTTAADSVVEAPAVRTTTEHFLMLEIPRGASKDDLVRAVEKALMTTEVPFFRDRGNPATGTPAAGTTTGGSTGGAFGGLGLGPDDALLMLVKQEGWP